MKHITKNDRRTKMMSQVNVVNAIGVLTALPEKKCVELSLKDSIMAMRSQICDLLSRNYTVVEIVDALNNEAGFNIKLTTFRSYICIIDKEIIDEIREIYHFNGKMGTLFNRKNRSAPNTCLAYQEVIDGLEFKAYLNTKYSAEELIKPRSVNEVIADLQSSKI